MGGASRNEKRRRQEEANRRLAAAGIVVPEKSGPNRTALIVVAVVLVVAVAIGAVLLLTRDSGTPTAATYPTTVSGAVVTAGNGPVVVDVYEDFLCPNCERFEARYDDDITTALNGGKITVKYHAVAILDRATTPPGYSTRAANAALCSVPAGVFPGYHRTLFDNQPAEGSAGLTDDQLIAFGTELKATGDFAGCVRGGGNAAAITAETKAAAANPALQIDGKFGTPTVAVGGERVDLNNTNWLKDAIGG